MGGVVDLFAGGEGTDFKSGGDDPVLRNDYYLDKNFGQQITNRQAMQDPQIATGPQDQFRAQQMAFAQQLMNQANGVGPSVAQQQLQAGTDQNIAAQMALAASGRPTNAAYAQRLAMQGIAGSQQQMAQQSAMLRNQEQLNAQGLLGQALAQGRGQDIGMATDQAKIGLQSQALKDQFNLGLTGLGTQRDVAQMQGAFGLADLQEQSKKRRAQGVGALSGLLAGAGSSAITGATAGSGASAGSGSSAGASGGVAESGAGAAAAASDENLKTNIKSGESDLKAFLSTINAHSYEYKEGAKDLPLAGKGRYVSPMAQELEKSEIGRSMVKDTPDGKMVDYGKGLGAMLAAQAMLNKRLEKLEGEKND